MQAAGTTDMNFSTAGLSDSDMDFSAAEPSVGGAVLCPFQLTYLQVIESAKRKQHSNTSNDVPKGKKSRKDPAVIESYGDLYSKYQDYVSQSCIPWPAEKQSQRAWNLHTLAGIESYTDVYSKYRDYISQSRISWPAEKQSQRNMKSPQATTTMFAVSWVREIAT